MDYNVGFDVFRFFLTTMAEYNLNQNSNKKYIFSNTLSNEITEKIKTIYSSQNNSLINGIELVLGKSVVDIFPHRKYLRQAVRDDLYTHRPVYVKFNKTTNLDDNGIEVTNDSTAFTTSSYRTFEPNTNYTARVSSEHNDENSKIFLENTDITANFSSYLYTVFVERSLIDELCMELITLYENIMNSNFNSELNSLYRGIRETTFPFPAGRKGGSKTKRQRKQRRRKQKSKRKRN